MNNDIISGMQIMYPVIGTMSLLICSIIGYIGSKLYDQLKEMSGTLRTIERDLRKDLAGLDRRVTKLESFTDLVHTRREDDQ